MAKRWPAVFLGYQLTCFLDTKVACQRIVVMPANKLFPDDFRNIGEALVVKHVIDVLPALLIKLLVRLLVGPQLPSLLVLGLQFV